MELVSSTYSISPVPTSLFRRITKKVLQGALVWLIFIFLSPDNQFWVSDVYSQPQTAKLTQVKSVGDPEFQSANAVITDKNGAVYIAGQFKGTIQLGSTILTSDGLEDIFVAKIIGNNFIWAVQGKGDQTDNVTSIALDTLGDIYICGSFNSTALDFDNLILTNTQPGAYDAFIYKLDQTAGSVLWFQSGGGVGDDRANDVAIDKFNQIYITGFFEDDALFSGNPIFSEGKRDIFTARYNDIGNLIWVEQAGGERDDYGSSLVTDSVGTVYVSGSYASDSCIFAFLKINNTDIVGSYDPFIVAYDSTRMPIWSKGCGGFGDDFGNALAIDTLSNELYLAGAYTNSARFDNEILVNENVTGKSIYLAKFDDAGNFLWATKGDGPSAEAVKVAIDYKGNVYTTGFFTEELNFGCTGLSESYQNLGGVNLDIFVTKHTTDGIFMNAHRAGSDNAPDEGKDLYFSSVFDKLFIAGYFSDTTDFSPQDVLISKGKEDAFLAVVQYGPSACGIPTRKGRKFKKITPVCEFSNDTIFYTGFTGKVKRWEKSENNGVSYQPVDIQTAYYPIGRVTKKNTIIRPVIQSCACDSIIGDTVRLDAISVPTVGGKISGAKTVCFLSNTGQLRLSDNVGLVLRWESSIDNFVSNTTQIANTTNTLIYNNITVNTRFRVLLQNGLCASNYSDTVTITADSCQWCGQPPTKGGVAKVQGGGPTALCATGNVAAVILTGNVGLVTRWEVSNDDFGTIQVFPGGGNTFQLTNLTQKTSIRAQVRNMNCYPEVSKAVTFTIDSCEACQFAPTKPGSISLSTNEVLCAAKNTITLKINGYFENVLYWEYSFNKYGPFFPIRNQTDELIANNLTQTRWYRAVIKATSCRVERTDTVRVKVQPCLKCPTVTKPKATFVTDRSAIITWKTVQLASQYAIRYRELGASTWNIAFTNSSPFTLNNLLPARTYQMQIQTICGANSSSTLTNIFEFTTSCSSPGNVFADQDTVCAGNNSITLEAPNIVGSVVRWEFSTDGFKTISRKNTQSSVFYVDNINVNTQFRVVVIKDNCIGVVSDPVSVYVRECFEPCAKPSVLIAENITPVSADIRWAFGPGAESFELSYKAVQDAQWTTISGLDDQFTSIKNLAFGSEYLVRLRNICSGEIYSDYSDTIHFFTPTPPPNCETPSNIQISTDLTSASLSWGPVNGAVYYEIRYRPTHRPTPVTLTTTNPEILLQNLEPDRSYKLVLRTFCGNKYSAYTPEFIFQTRGQECNIPAQLKELEIQPTGVKISWTNVERVYRYTVRYRATGTTTWNEKIVIFNFVTLDGLFPGTTYEYQVNAQCNANSATEFSPSSFFRTPTLRTLYSENLNSFELYPNPNKGIFNISFYTTKNQIVKLELFDILGTSIYKRELTSNEGLNNISVELNNLSSGVYLMKMDDQVVSKVVIE